MMPVTNITKNSAKITVSIATIRAITAQIASTITDFVSSSVTNVPKDPKNVIIKIPNLRSAAHITHNITAHTATATSIFVISKPAITPTVAPITAPTASPTSADNTLTIFSPNKAMITPTTTVAIKAPIISGVFPATKILVGPSADFKTDVTFSISILLSLIPLIIHNHRCRFCILKSIKGRFSYLPLECYCSR